MWAQKDFGSLGDTKLYEKVRNFFSKNFMGARPEKGPEKMIENTNRAKIKFCNFFPELQINLRKRIIFPCQEISYIKKSENFFLKISWVRDGLKIRDL